MKSKVVGAALALVVGSGLAGVGPAAQPARADNFVDFTTPGGPYTYVVPSGVTEVLVLATGGQGAPSVLGAEDGTHRGGPGGIASGYLRVSEGETFYVYVGAAGASDGTGGAGVSSGGAGGLISDSCTDTDSGGGGGGTSEVRAGADDVARRVLLAGGGGGAAGQLGHFGAAGEGGAGGGDTAADGGPPLDGSGQASYFATGGGGGTQTGGGAGGAGADTDGTAGTHASGGDGGGPGCGPTGGGGGGGSYGGGGGGTSGDASAGGGGGSNFINTSLLTDAASSQGDADHGPFGDGHVVFEELTPSVTLTAPNGGESWARGTTHTISWDYAHADGLKVKMVLRQSGNLVRRIATVPVGSGGIGAFDWTVPTDLTPGTGYSIRVQIVKQQASDRSDAPFAIT